MDLYYDYTSYGVSNYNLDSGLVTENKNYVFFAEEDTEPSVVHYDNIGDIVMQKCTSSRIVQFDKNTKEYKELDTGMERATYLNIYQNKLYYYREDGVYCCDIGEYFGDNARLLWQTNTKANVNGMLLAENMIVISETTTDFSTVQSATVISLIDLSTLSTILEINLDGIQRFRYFGKTIYYMNPSSQSLQGLNLRTAETMDYPTPESFSFSEPMQGGLILWDTEWSNDYSTSKSTIYKFDPLTGKFTGYFYANNLEQLCVSNDNMIFIVVTDGNYNSPGGYVTLTIQDRTMDKYETQFTSPLLIQKTYIIDYPEEISRLGWKGNATLGIWSTNGNGFSISS